MQLTILTSEFNLPWRTIGTSLCFLLSSYHFVTFTCSLKVC